MSQYLPLKSVAAATGDFVDGVKAKGPVRLEAKVSSADGMPLLCAVEAVLEALPRSTMQELVWLNGAPASGLHLLQLQAFGADNVLLAEARHEFATQPVTK
ncbi:MAG: hypothetical protein WDN45_09960 [Caulobacteraceae bacterium]